MRTYQCKCRHLTQYAVVAPTGKKHIGIIVDACSMCGRNYPVYPERLTRTEASWVRRWNERIDRSEAARLEGLEKLVAEL